MELSFLAEIIPALIIPVGTVFFIFFLISNIQKKIPQLLKGLPPLEKPIQIQGKNLPDPNKIKQMKEAITHFVIKGIAIFILIFCFFYLRNLYGFFGF